MCVRYVNLSALRTAFRLAWKSKPRLIQEVPPFRHLTEAAPRAAFIEEQEYRRLAAGAAHSLWLRALLATAYSFGFRRGELLNLHVKDIDLIERTIALNPGTTKNDEGRVVVMTTDVYLLLQAWCAGSRQLISCSHVWIARRRLKSFVMTGLFSAGMLDWAGYCVRIAGKKKLK